MAEKFQFKYLTAPTGELSGQSMVQQTEDAINALGKIADKSENDSSSAVAIANQAMQKADNAQSVANNLSVQMEALSASVQTIQETVDANTEQSLQAVSLAQASANSAQVSELSAKTALANSNSAKLSADLSAASAEQSQTVATQAQADAAASAEAAKQAQAKAEEAQGNAENAQNAAQVASNAASGSAASASASATNASDSADLSKKWAVSTESPDGEADTESSTNLTQSSRTWALESKAQATASKASADSASASASTAQSYANTATSSATTATTSATTATTKAGEASASATEAKNAADEAKQALADADVSTVLRYTAQTLTDAQKTQARTNIGVDMSGYLPLAGGTMTGPIYAGNWGKIYGNFGTSYKELILEGSSPSSMGGFPGATLALRSQASREEPGSFALLTYGDSGFGPGLVGDVEGHLSWGGNFTTNGYLYVNPVSSLSVEGGQIELVHGTNATTGISLDTTSGIFRVFGNGGSVGTIFMLNPQTGNINWNGTIYGAVLQATSDIRKKSDIKEVAPDLSSVKSYEYTLKDDKKRHVGLIAQEVEKVLPTAVSENEDGFKSLDYNSVVAALVSEVNALKKRVKELEEK